MSVTIKTVAKIVLVIHAVIIIVGAILVVVAPVPSYAKRVEEESQFEETETNLKKKEQGLMITKVVVCIWCGICLIFPIIGLVGVFRRNSCMMTTGIVGVALAVIGYIYWILSPPVEQPLYLVIMFIVAFPFFIFETVVLLKFYCAVRRGGAGREESQESHVERA